jgi:hypothetical protein
MGAAASKLGDPVGLARVASLVAPALRRVQEKKKAGAASSAAAPTQETRRVGDEPT